jgi:hypothetical protein
MEEVIIDRYVFLTYVLLVGIKISEIVVCFINPYVFIFALSMLSNSLQMFKIDGKSQNFDKLLVTV